MKTEKLVSIILPAYNTDLYVGEAIQSCIDQTYHNWELLIVDDCSSDNTFSVILDYAKSDNRIKPIRLNENCGSAIARTTAIKMSMGEYIAFIDSDDKWYPEKLEKQIAFMQQNNYNFTCTKVVKCNMDWRVLDDDIRVYDVYDYNKLLKRCPSNITVIYNAEKLGRYSVPNIKKRTDYVLWLKIIKDAKHIYALPEPLAAYRVRKGSVSSSKIKLIKYHWHIYREIEHLGIVRSTYLIFFIIVRKLFGI